MAHTGKTTRPGTCAICKQVISVGVIVFFDASKRQGNHLAHEQCYIDLRASREIQPPRGREKLSTEPLDPPF